MDKISVTVKKGNHLDNMGHKTPTSYGVIKESETPQKQAYQLAHNKKPKLEAIPIRMHVGQC